MTEEALVAAELIHEEIEAFEQKTHGHRSACLYLEIVEKGDLKPLLETAQTEDDINHIFDLFATAKRKAGALASHAW